jgi:hypothetical protein
MNKFTVFPIIFLFFLPGTGMKKYDHSYHQGHVTLSHLHQDLKPSHSKCQLDYTIIKDSLIVGRFQVINPPSDWKIIPEGTFHGIITKVTNEKSVSANSTFAQYEWKTKCSFDSLDGHIKISKTITNAQGHDHFIGFLETAGTLENRSEIHFYLE